MQKYDKIYINGKWIAPQSTDKALEVFDSTNEEVMASIPSCNAKDVDAAAQAARAGRAGVSADQGPVHGRRAHGQELPDQALLRATGASHVVHGRPATL